MSHLMRRALESAMFTPDEPPEDDKMMLQFKQYFPNHFELSEAEYALEERADGKADKEIEFTIYARLVDMSQLSEAKSKESQEQWEIRIPKTEGNAGAGSMRVRKTQIEGADPVFTRAIKIPYNKDNDKIEIPLPSNEDEFTAFKFLSEKGMVKDRFHFPILGTDMVWEIDCFPKEGGGYHEWVKIDLEVKDRDMALPEFPVKLEDVILPKDFGKMSPEEHDKKVSELYDLYFLAKNSILAKIEAKQEGEESAQLGNRDSVDTGDAQDTPQPAPDATPAQSEQTTEDNPSGEEVASAEEKEPEATSQE